MPRHYEPPLSLRHFFCHHFTFAFDAPEVMLAIYFDAAEPFRSPPDARFLAADVSIRYFHAFVCYYSSFRFIFDYFLLSLQRLIFLDIFSTFSPRLAEIIFFDFRHFDTPEPLLFRRY
jgi:hypothetical protein